MLFFLLQRSDKNRNSVIVRSIDLHPFFPPSPDNVDHSKGLLYPVNRFRKVPLWCERVLVRVPLEATINRQLQGRGGHSDKAAAYAGERARWLARTTCRSGFPKRYGRSSVGKKAVSPLSGLLFAEADRQNRVTNYPAAYQRSSMRRGRVRSRLLFEPAARLTRKTTRGQEEEEEEENYKYTACT